MLENTSKLYSTVSRHRVSSGASSKIARAVEKSRQQRHSALLPPRRADAKMTPPWSVAARYYRELINLLKYLLYLFIIRTLRCGPELSRASKQLPLNSSCNGHAECAGVQSDFISLRSSDRAYITRAFLRRLSRAAPSLFPGYGPRGHLRPLVFALFLPPSVEDSTFFAAVRTRGRISAW